MPKEDRPVLPDSWVEFDYSDPDPDAVKEETDRLKQGWHKLHKPVDKGVDEERGPFDVIPLSMTRGGEAKPQPVFKTPMKHMVLDQSIPPRGWYKSKIEADRVRPRPCLLPDALVNTPWGVKEIQLLKPGDIILGFNEETGKVAQTYVQAVMSQVKCEYLEVELVNGRVLKLTPEHLVYTRKRGWIEAQTLTEADDIVDLGQRYQRQMERLCGIYGLRNLIDGKLYVGSARDVVARLNKHMHKLTNGMHANMHLQAAYNKGAKFELVLLEVCNADILVEREQYYINLYECMDNTKGYNMTVVKAAVSKAHKKVIL